jgi:site-specific recombinase XerD
MNTLISISQAIEGYLLAAGARHLSPHTIADYKNTFNKFLSCLDQDPPIADITNRQIESFLASREGVTKKTILNYYVGLSALWTWAVSEDLASRNVVRLVTPPKPEQREIIPFTADEIVVMLNALEKSKFYSLPGKRSCANSLPHPERNRAIILLLVDTGLRASELCAIRIRHLDTRNQRISIFGKGDKERSIPYSYRTGHALWRYLAIRRSRQLDSTKPAAQPDDFLFLTTRYRQMNRDRLLNLLKNIGERAGIPNVHPHRFRHTFAIMYLRNGGDPYTLQYILGHSTMEMVKTYLRLAQIDLDNAHRRASPVDHLNI